MTSGPLYEITLKAYGDANLRLKCIEMVNTYGKTAEERLELDRQYGEAIHDAVRAKAALDALVGHQAGLYAARDTSTKEQS